MMDHATMEEHWSTKAAQRQHGYGRVGHSESNSDIRSWSVAMAVAMAMAGMDLETCVYFIIFSPGGHEFTPPKGQPITSSGAQLASKICKLGMLCDAATSLQEAVW